ncbi:hypothetical protein [Leptospira noguchii]|uniref:Uncharacterized protein n=1 Tax=Leptospira noguchii serovar Panama str. CZ214 TaxID=1001595 RepID=T0GV62_9LEPT|nr:hypothetical protein [Leptospira noguchii]EQA72822.1 hypothetical protein LEP1GSC059_3391 [Leptospira noguchii serovar Panama str. CZ214]
MKINSDFIADLEIQFKNEMIEAGYKNVPESGDAIFISYFKLQHRLIDSVPRNILKSDIFQCPSDYLNGLHELEENIRQGANINSHQSSQLLDVKKNDPLLNDWGIYHLHLGLNSERNGFVQRTSPLLFAHFTYSTAFLIDVINHGNWSDNNLIETLQRNWPETIRHWEVKLQDIEEISASERDKIRKAGGLLFTKINGKIFAPPGGGYTTSGTSINAVMESDKFKSHIRDIEKEIISNAKIYEKAIRQKLGVKIQSIKLKLKFQLGNLYAIEENYNLTFNLGRV